MRILVVPDKFKGTLSAQDAAEAIARGWRKVRPDDELKLLPMSDGGDGFGEVLADSIGAKSQKIKTINAAHKFVETIWWWEPKTKTAIIESAKVIGLAMLPPGKFHPFELDTFGLGKALLAASRCGAKTCFIGVGGSATNDAGFGMARSLGWRFFDGQGIEIQNWTRLNALKKIVPPKNRRLFPRLIVAVDVQNPLLGKRGCSAIYGPQKGLTPDEIPLADALLKTLAKNLSGTLHRDFSKVPGSGAAGGLGFGLMTFASAKPESGFEIFARHSQLKKRLRNADFAITGEGSLDRQTLMGKGVGQIALLCRELGVPCIGVAGVVTEPERARKLFTATRSLTDFTTLKNAKKNPAKFMEKAAETLAREIKVFLNGRRPR